MGIVVSLMGAKLWFYAFRRAYLYRLSLGGGYINGIIRLLCCLLICFRIWQYGTIGIMKYMLFI